MSRHPTIPSNNDASPLVIMTTDDANQIIINVLGLDTLQHTDYVNGIIAGHKLYATNPCSINLVNNILEKVPNIPSIEYNNVKLYYQNNYSLRDIISQFSISTLAYYGI
tara:strand:+ start:747 stop:1073 length:327 start_codon:yes stop_codon:yes gene_type:complete